MTFSDQTVALLLVVLVPVTLALGVLAGLLVAAVARLRRDFGAVVGRDRRRDVFDVLHRQAGELERLREDIGIVHRNTEHLRELLGGTVSRIGVVRYDAFEDMGGQLSFSAALLDEHGNGLVLSAINGRSETRSYAKLLRDGRSEQNLSPEEQAAIETAQRETGSTRRVERGRRRGARA